MTGVLGGEKQVVSEVPPDALGLHLDGWWNPGRLREGVHTFPAEETACIMWEKQKQAICGNQPDFNGKFC